LRAEGYMEAGIDLKARDQTDGEKSRGESSEEDD
jgi:hypothetical protein